jgi:hypothetical protein
MTTTSGLLYFFSIEWISPFDTCSNKEEDEEMMVRNIRLKDLPNSGLYSSSGVKV